MIQLKRALEVLFRNQSLDIDAETLVQVDTCYKFLEDFAKNKVIYGINTGFGPMAQWRVAHRTRGAAGCHLRGVALCGLLCYSYRGCSACGSSAVYAAIGMHGMGEHYPYSHRSIWCPSFGILCRTQRCRV